MERCKEKIIFIFTDRHICIYDRLKQVRVIQCIYYKLDSEGLNNICFIYIRLKIQPNSVRVRHMQCPNVRNNCQIVLKQLTKRRSNRFRWCHLRRQRL